MPGSRRLSRTLKCLLLGAPLCVCVLLFSASVRDVCLFSFPARVAPLAGAQGGAPLPAAAVGARPAPPRALPCVVQEKDPTTLMTATWQNTPWHPHILWLLAAVVLCLCAVPMSPAQQQRLVVIYVGILCISTPAWRQRHGAGGGGPRTFCWSRCCHSQCSSCSFGSSSSSNSSPAVS